MADNVPITPGTGATIATDDVAGVQFQKIKLDLGGDGASSPATGDSNGLDVDVTRPPVAATSTLTNINASVTTVNLLASNSSRKGVIVFNDSTSNLYIKFGVTASTTSFTIKLLPSDTWCMDSPIYTGGLDGIWDSANGAARITELT